jgi:hypothetical protein
METLQNWRIRQKTLDISNDQKILARVERYLGLENTGIIEMVIPIIPSMVIQNKYTARAVGQHWNKKNTGG